jgi:DNA-binding LytR/AlgR family response regulator
MIVTALIKFTHKVLKTFVQCHSSNLINKKHNKNKS